MEIQLHEKKKKLFPNDVSPGLGVPSKVGGWNMNEPTSEWRKDYGDYLCGGKISFDFAPMNVTQFFQGNNYLKEEAKIWPMPILDKLLFQMVFKIIWTTFSKTRVAIKANTDFILTTSTWW